MRRALVGAIVVLSIIACALTEYTVCRMVRYPDATSAAMGGFWLGMPYLAAIGLAFQFRRRPATLIVLLVTLLSIAGVGLSLFDSAATQQEIAQQQVDTAVQPGEDPNSGPAGMRKTGADVGLWIGGAFAILVAVVLPPIQLITVIAATMITYGISAMVQKSAESTRVPEQRKIAAPRIEEGA